MQPVFFLVEDRHIDSYTTGLRFGVGLLRSVTRTRARDGKFGRLDMGKQVVQTLRLSASPIMFLPLLLPLPRLARFLQRVRTCKTVRAGRLDHFVQHYTQQKHLCTSPNR